MVDCGAEIGGLLGAALADVDLVEGLGFKDAPFEGVLFAL